MIMDDLYQFWILAGILAGLYRFRKHSLFEILKFSIGAFIRRSKIILEMLFRAPKLTVVTVVGFILYFAQK